MRAYSKMQITFLIFISFGNTIGGGSGRAGGYIRDKDEEIVALAITGKREQQRLLVSCVGG